MVRDGASLPCATIFDCVATLAKHKLGEAPSVARQRENAWLDLLVVKISFMESPHLEACLTGDRS